MVKRCVKVWGIVISLVEPQRWWLSHTSGEVTSMVIADDANHQGLSRFVASGLQILDGAGAKAAPFGPTGVRDCGQTAEIRMSGDLIVGHPSGLRIS